MLLDMRFGLMRRYVLDAMILTAIIAGRSGAYAPPSLDWRCEFRPLPHLCHGTPVHLSALARIRDTAIMPKVAYLLIMSIYHMARDA